MKKVYLYATAFFMLLTVACSDDAVTAPDASATDNSEAGVSENAMEGELLIKFVPEMTELLDEAFKNRTEGVPTRSGLPSTDEVLDILGAYEFERVFPVDSRTEERTREAGLHLWYLVRFDENTDLNKAVARVKQLGEVSKVQCNHKIYRLQQKQPKAVCTETTTTRSVSDDAPFNDPELYRQWGYINRGGYDFETERAKAIAGCDVGCEEAWKLCTGDPSIIVAVLDEGVMYNHPDLAANMWVNEDEIFGSDKDTDGNGYKGDRYGYNFSTDRGFISFSGSEDTGHGTHVAGTVAAVNGNGIGVCGVAGGNAAEGKPGVRIMSCQVFDDAQATTVAMEAKAVKYATDNGAVILQCSWGYNSALSNEMLGYTPGPASDKEWEEAYPLEKEAFDYFVNNAGSPNGVIDGGIAIFASGNEYSAMPAYPGAYHKLLSVAALAADYTPSTYTDYGTAVDFSAPGGDSDYYGVVGSQDDSEDMIYSTLVKEGKAAYGYYEGSSMACPHVSGVAALGLSYAKQLRRHFKAEEFIELMRSTATDIDYRYKGAEKFYHYNHFSPGASPSKLYLTNYVGKMGKLINAAALLNAIADAGSDMKLPNIYVATKKSTQLDLAAFFIDGENLAYSVTVADDSVAKATVSGTMLTVEGQKEGSTTATITVSDGSEQTITIIVRNKANSNGWM